MMAWITAGNITRLIPNELRIFRSSLESTQEELEDLAGILSHEELQRADRFVFRNDRDRFVKSRGVLRQILGSLLDVSEREIQLSAGQFGKPCLSPEVRDCPLKFNLSHSHELALYAFSLQREVGIDLEKILSGHETIRDVSQYFSAAERERIESAPGEAQIELFYRCWVMKEAFVKASGKGLQIPLSSFELPTNWADMPEGIINLTENWIIIPFTPGTTYTAAAVIEAGTTETTLWDWKRNNN